MLTYKVIVTEQAEKGLINLFEYYIDIAGYLVAEANITAIEICLESLNRLPHRYQISDFSSQIRRLVVPNLPFLVYYTILELEQEVHILEVLDSRKDLIFLKSKYKNYG